jgi:hypothetical protein
MTNVARISGLRISLIGLAVGWLVGFVWWVGFLLASPPGFERNAESEQLVKRPRIAAADAFWAAFCALPWAAMGLLVGGCTAQFRGFSIPVAAVVGTAVGFVWCIATSPNDGWLALTVPLSSLTGTFVGLLIGVPTRAVWGDLRGWDKRNQTDD